MAGSFFSFFNKVQSTFSSSAPLGVPPVVPELKQLDDMVYEVWSPLPEKKPTLEIIFFHGLQQRYSKDAYFTTWMSYDNSQLWLRTWLVEAFPTARILTISYDASLTTRSGVVDLDMYRISENLVSSLVDRDVRVGQARCPVVLVGHCLGGLVLKQICLDAAYMSSRKKDERFGVGRVNDLLSNVRGMFFYGTPQTGSLLGDELPKHMKSELAQEIETLKASTMRRNEEFRALQSRYNWLTYGIGEQDKTFLECLQKSIHVVPEASARPYMDDYCSIGGDHFNISKPSGKNASGFSKLANFLQQIQDDGILQVIQNVPLAFTDISDLDKATKQEESYWMVPSKQVSHYIKRIDLLERVKTEVQQMWAEKRHQVVVLLGMGGQGKSQLAMEYCRMVRMSKEFRAIFWIDASSIKSTHRSFENIASKIADPSRTFGNMEEKVAFVRDTMDGWDSRWLLVFDNYDAPTTDFNVATLFPSSPFGTILVTSRHEDSKGLGKVIPLTKMTEQESLELLFRRSENELIDENMETGRSIIAKLGFLPLAIDQAGAFISAQKLPLTLFLEQFDLQKEEILKYTPALTEYRRALGDDGKETTLNVFTTWELSFQQINKDETGERLRSFLTTATFFNTRDIGEDLFHSANDLETVPLWIDAFLFEGDWDSLKYRKFLTELSKLSLLNFAIQDTKQCRFDLHPLIADWLRLRVGRDISRLCTIESCYLLAKLIEKMDLESCGYAFRLYLLEHVDDCLSNKRTYSTHVDQDVEFTKILSVQFGRLLRETSRYREGISLVEEALPIIETAYGKDHASTLETVYCLGSLYHEQKKLAEAKEMYEHALAGYEKAFGRDHASTLNTVHCLGSLYHEQGKLAEAKEMYEHALVGYEKVLGKDHALTLDTIHNLGVLYHEQGKLAEAEEMYEHALAGYEKAFGKDHASTLSAVSSLGTLYHKQGKLAEAEKMLKHALAGYEKAFGKDHASTLGTVNYLGSLYREQGKLAEAQEMYEHALVGYEKVLGKDHALTLDTINNLGILYHEQGKLAEAKKMYEHALVGYEKAFGKDHASTLRTIHNLGVLYHEQGKLAEAKEMYKRALTGFEKALGRDHKFTLDTICNMAKLLEKQEDLKAASQMFERAFFGYTDLLGADNYKTIAAQQQLERINHLQQKKVNTEKLGLLEKSTTAVEVKDGLSSNRD